MSWRIFGQSILKTNFFADFNGTTLFKICEILKEREVSKYFELAVKIWNSKVKVTKIKALLYYVLYGKWKLIEMSQMQILIFEPELALLVGL